MQGVDRGETSGVLMREEVLWGTLFQKHDPFTAETAEKILLKGLKPEDWAQDLVMNPSYTY